MLRCALRRLGLLIAILIAIAIAIIAAGAHTPGTRGAHFWDVLCLLLMLLLPLVFVLRWNLAGMVAGAILFWGIGVLAGRIAQSLNPGRDAALLDGIWLMFGFVAGLLYCVPIYFVKLLVGWFARRAESQKIPQSRLLTD